MFIHLDTIQEVNVEEETLLCIVHKRLLQISARSLVELITRCCYKVKQLKTHKEDNGIALSLGDSGLMGEGDDLWPVPVSSQLFTAIAAGDSHSLLLQGFSSAKTSYDQLTEVCIVLETTKTNNADWKKYHKSQLHKKFFSFETKAPNLLRVVQIILSFFRVFFFPFFVFYPMKAFCSHSKRVE